MPRVPTAFVVAGVFFAQAFILLAIVHFAAPLAVFVVGPIAGLVGAGACLAARRANFVKPAAEEPWRLDAWGSLLAGLALPALGFCVGPEAAALGWLLAALHVGLGAMALSGRA
jgi:hypothetical protein